MTLKLNDGGEGEQLLNYVWPHGILTVIY